MVIVQFWRLWYSPKSTFFWKFSRFLSQIYTLENICSNFPRLFSTLGKFSHLHIWGLLKSQFYGAVTGMKIPVLTLQRSGGATSTPAFFGDAYLSNASFFFHEILWLFLKFYLVSDAKKFFFKFWTGLPW